jgi:hypothetical protein
MTHPTEKPKAKAEASTRSLPSHAHARAGGTDARLIPGHPRYAATSDGEIVNVETGLILSGHIAAGRYLYVSLGRETKRGIHRLVAMAFHGLPPTPKHEAAHCNGDCLDNRPENLRWATRTENEADKVAHGTNNRVSFQGAAHPRTHLTEDDVATIRAAGVSSTILAKRYGVHSSTIRAIVRWDTWRNVGGAHG